MSVPNNLATNSFLISLGSNIQPAENLTLAIKLLTQKVNILGCSSVWRSPAVGSSGPDFLNAAVLIQSPLSSNDLKTRILRRIENELGRIRTEDKNAARTIDLDILIFNAVILDQDLFTQAYLAIPAAELQPDLPHPTTGVPLREAANKLAAEMIKISAASLDLTHFINH